MNESYKDPYRVIELLEAARVRMAELNAEIEKIKASMNEVKASTRKYVATVLPHCDEHDLMQLASILYWLYDDLIDAQTVANVLNCGSNAVGSRVKGYGIVLQCIDCRKDVTYYPTSRSDAQYHKGSGDCVCDECQEKRSQRSRQRTEQMQATIEYLRSMPYRDYLKTEHWQNLRTRMLKRSNFRCQLCNKQGQLHVHHRTYANRGNEDYKDLIVLCADCHQAFHETMETPK